MFLPSTTSPAAILTLLFGVQLWSCQAFLPQPSCPLLQPTTTSSTTSWSARPSFTTTTTTRPASSPTPTTTTVLHMSATAKKAPGTAKLDKAWEDLGFEFRPTNSHVRVTYRDGAWSEPEIVKVRLLVERTVQLPE
jgi:hypothetical protein